MAKLNLYFTKKGTKHVRSDEYNYDFDMRTGAFARWGRTEDDDPTMSPLPELADIEVSTACDGVGSPCKFCYKNNGPKGENMSLDTFKSILPKIGPLANQIAFGIGNLDANPDLFPIMKYSREHGIIPNITINGAHMTKELYKSLAEVCGAVAVSNYDKDVCYSAVENLSKEGLKQVNIHQLLSEETFDQCMSLLDDCITDERLKGLRAVVFLVAKPKGRGVCLHPLSNIAKYKTLIDKAMGLKVSFGFDSCSAPLFLAAVKDHPNYKQFYEMAEPCESLLFSIYIDVKGRVWPCSFLANSDFPEIYVQDVKNFGEIWHHPKAKEWRENLLKIANDPKALVNGCRECPIYKDIYPR